MTTPADRPARRRIGGVLAALALVATLAPGASAAGTWTLSDHPAPPPGAPFKVPLGAPGDLQFFAPNRGLLAVEGNSTIARGLYVYDGAAWRQLATVCGGTADTTRIAWAGPTEFWTISEPSLPRAGGGLALCRFVNGEVVGSFSTAEQSPDPYRRMNAAACNSPSDCVFAGVASSDPTSQRRGTFHLRWDGTTLRSHYEPQDRAASDLESFGGELFATRHVGRRPEGRDGEAPQPELPEDRPHLLHRIAAGTFIREPFNAADLPAPDPSYGAAPPRDATDLLALDSDGSDLWAVGGGTASGACPSPPAPGTSGGCEDTTGLGGIYDRQPIAVRREGAGFRELALSQTFERGERFVDVAAVPGSDESWVAVQRFLDRRNPTARAKLARLGPDGTVREVLTLPASGSGRGAAAKIAFTGPNEGWMVTTAGWIFHFTDGTPLARDTDTAFAGPITFRPNEAAAQFIPDAPPVDDSRLFEPPPIEDEPPPAATIHTKVQRLAPLLRAVRTRLKGRRLMIISFRVTRTARIGVTGRRRGRVVARARPRALKPGRRSIRLRLDPRRYPTRLTFQVREAGATTSPGADDTAAGDGDTVTTGP